MVHRDRDKRKGHSKDAPLKEERAKRRRGGRRLGSEVAAGSGFTQQRRSRLWSEARARFVLQKVSHHMAAHFQIKRLNYSANEKMIKWKNANTKEPHFFTIISGFFFFLFFICGHVLKRGRSDLWALKLD